MFRKMTAPRSALSGTRDQQKASSDLVIPNSQKGSPGTATDALQEVLEQALAQTIEAKVEARLAVLLEGIGDAFYALDGMWRFTYLNRGAQAYFGAQAHEMLGRSIWDLYPESEGTELRRRYEEVAATGIATAFEAEAVGIKGRYLEMRVFPYDGGLGISFRDWTERRRTEDELRESEARLSALADNLPTCMVYQMSDGPTANHRQLLYLSQNCERLTGVAVEDIKVNRTLLYNLVLPKYRERLAAQEAEATREHKTFDMELEMFHARTGEIRWYRLTVTPRPLPNGSIVWDGLQIDITEHKRAEEHLRLMINELNHRVKNTLATVQSLAAQSFHRFGMTATDDVGAACAAFEARLFALSRAHDVLTRENWEGANLADVVREAYVPFLAHVEDESRIEMSGPNLRIPPAMALSLSMAIHELCTNALKYGALKTSAGSIGISWSSLSEGGDTRLVFRWEERGGPPVSPPRRTGFGSRLIQKGLARELNGSAHIAYEPTGVICTIDVPLDVPLS